MPQPTRRGARRRTFTCESAGLARGVFAGSMVDSSSRHVVLSPGNEHGRAGGGGLSGGRSWPEVAHHISRVAAPGDDGFGRAEANRATTAERRERQYRLGYAVRIAHAHGAGATDVAGADEYRGRAGGCRRAARADLR